MSQNKTIIPGVDYNYSDSQDDLAFGNLYSPSGADDQQGYVPDMRQQPQTVLPGNIVGSNSPAMLQPSQSSRQVVMQERIVVGVLFSVSRSLLGDMLPIYLGNNIIGQAPNCDISLKEKTISQGHAILHTQKTGAGITASITDFNSTHGTLVNETDARYETISVRENDIITIGRNYRFIVKFFETDKYGLTENSDFEDAGADNYAADSGNAVSPGVDFYSPTRQDDNSNRTVIY